MIKWVKTRECKEEDILAEDIVNEAGTVIAKKYTLLNHYIISILHHFGISRVKILCNKSSLELNQEQCYAMVKGQYKENIQSVKEVLCNLVADNNLQMDKLEDIVNHACGYMEDTYSIVKVMNEEKEFDEYTYTHSINVAIYAMLIGKWMKLDQESIQKLIVAGLLHDVGKMKIPYDVLNKKSKLTDAEFALLKKHPEFGYDIVKEQNGISEDISRAVLLHHERMDGSGYPYHCAGEDINLYARIIAVADVYDAITTNRVYKSKRTPFEAFNIFKTEEVKNMDPRIVHAFITNISIHYVGMNVLLNTGEVGKIVYIPPQSVSNPIVGLNHDYIDLSKDQEKNIVKVV